MARRIKRKDDNLLRDALILFGIMAVLGLILGLVYNMTKPAIDESAVAAKNEAYIRTFPGQDVIPQTDESIDKLIADKGIIGEDEYKVKITDGVVINDKDNNMLGYSFIASTTGYNSDISVSVGIDKDGVVTGIDIVSMNETAGLGANCAEDSFKEQFIGKSGQIVVGEDIDAISGATITTDAVARVVNGCLGLVQDLR